MLDSLDLMLSSINFMYAFANSTVSTIITIAAIVSLLIGLCFCLWGYKIVKVLFAICGALIGSILGALFCTAVLDNYDMVNICGILGAILGAILLFKLYQVGVFVLAFTLGTLIVGLLTQFEGDSMILCLMAGLVVGILAVIWIRPSIIISTSISGASTASTAIATLAGISSGATTLIICLALAIMGIIYQFKHTDKSYGKKASVPAADATTTTTTTIHITPATVAATTATPTASAPEATPAPVIPAVEEAPPVIETPVEVAPIATPEPAPMTAPTEETAPAPSFCGSCGASLRQNARFCGICGTPTT